MKVVVCLERCMYDDDDGNDPKRFFGEKVFTVK